MSTEIKSIDIVNEIANLTGLKLDIVKLVMDAQELVVLDKILESQLSDDDTDFFDFGTLLIDSTDYPNLQLRASGNFQEKINQTIKTGRDYLSESIILQFNKDLLERYNLDGDSEIFESEPSIYEEIADE